MPNLPRRRRRDQNRRGVKRVPVRIGLTELILMSLLLLVFFGSRKVPEFIKGIADSVSEFKKSAGSRE